MLTNVTNYDTFIKQIIILQWAWHSVTINKAIQCLSIVILNMIMIKLSLYKACSTIAL